MRYYTALAFALILVLVGCTDSGPRPPIQVTATRPAYPAGTTGTAATSPPTPGVPQQPAYPPAATPTRLPANPTLAGPLGAYPGASTPGNIGLGQATTVAQDVCSISWFFDNPPSTCPASKSVQGRGAVEHFEHGLMVWNEDQDAIYVLFADDKTPGWAFLPDEFEDGQPETDPSLVPPSGLYQPIRGFGLIWRNHSLPAGTPVRDRLGWATDREKEIQTAIQCDNRPQDAICYLGWPDGKILEMRNGIGTWSIYR